MCSFLVQSDPVRVGDVSHSLSAVMVFRFVFVPAVVVVVSCSFRWQGGGEGPGLSKWRRSRPWLAEVGRGLFVSAKTTRGNQDVKSLATEASSFLFLLLHLGDEGTIQVVSSRRRRQPNLYPQTTPLPPFFRDPEGSMGLTRLPPGKPSRVWETTVIRYHPAGLGPPRRLPR